MAIDSVTLQILADHCAAATESMGHTLFRTAHSTFVKETEDFTTGLLRPARCIIPEGSLVNPKYPAAVGMRSLGAMRPSVVRVWRVRAGAAPHHARCLRRRRARSSTCAPRDPRTGRRLMANLDPITGGAGGVAFRDGTEGSGRELCLPQEHAGRDQTRPRYRSRY